MDIKNHDYANCPDTKCWLCHHWKYRIGRSDTLVDQNYECYVDGGRKPPTDKFLGFGGRVIIIQKGEQRIVTNNLWCVGTVPEYFRTPDRLPINCTITTGTRKDLLND